LEYGVLDGLVHELNIGELSFHFARKFLFHKFLNLFSLLLEFELSQFLFLKSLSFFLLDVLESIEKLLCLKLCLLLQLGSLLLFEFESLLLSQHIFLLNSESLESQSL